MTKPFQRVTAITPHPILRLVSLGLVTLIFTLFSLELKRIGAALAPLWFPTAIMMVACYRHAGRMWPGILVACTLGNVSALLLIDPLSSLNLWFPGINVVQALIGALLLRRMLPQHSLLKNLNDWVRLILCSAVILPLFGGIITILVAPGEEPLKTFLVWTLSDSIGAIALMPLGMLFKTQYLTRYRSPRLLVEPLITLSATLALSGLAIVYVPWPFICISVLLMWSAVRLPREEAFLVFLITVMMVSLMITTHPPALASHYEDLMKPPSWLPFLMLLMLLLPANIMTMVMHAFRTERKRIAESEERFRNAMEYSAIGMALVGPEGQWLQVNKALCRFLGYSEDELREQTFQQLTWPEDLNSDLEKLQQLINGDIHSYSMEKRYYTRSGNVVWALLAVSLVRNTNGAPLYFISQIEDINDLKIAERTNKRLMERITLANEAGGIGIWEWEIGPDIMNWDKQMFELYDVEPHSKPSWQLWLSRMLPEDRVQAEEMLREGLRTQMPFKLEFRIQVKDGIRHIRSLADRVLSKNDEGDADRLLGISMDMTEVKELNEQLYQEKERLHMTLDAIDEAVFCTDVDMRITFMNPVAEFMSGWPRQEAIGHPLLTVLRLTHGEDGPLIENLHSSDALRPEIEQDLVLHCCNGGNYDIHYSIIPLSTLDGRAIGSVLVIQDVTESRRMMHQLSHSASHDVLTHLANRASFENHLRHLLQTVHETHQHHALVFIDLDYFKAINDTAGHAAGDELLRKLAALMLSLLRNSDVLARLGGDEFGLLLPGCNLESARYLSERIIHAINNYHFMWEGRLHRIGASAGITLIDENNRQAPEVMSQADMACYASKSNGRGMVTAYDPQVHTASPGREQHYSQQRRS